MNNKWEKGSGTTIFGLFIMLTCTTMVLFFTQTFIIQQQGQAAQTAADSISDATAVYASTEGANYEDASSYASNVQAMVESQTGVKTTELEMNQELYEEDQKVDIKLRLNGSYTDPLYYLQDAAYKKEHSAVLSYRVPGKAQTEFTGIGTDYVQWMITIANDDSHGYCQMAGTRFPDGTVSTGRNLNPDVDCSSFVYFALKNAGYNVGDDVFATGQMDKALKGAGFIRLPYSSVTLKEGDILWRLGHTEVYIGEGKTVGAHIAEDGKSVNGRPGDQTGHEVDVGPLVGSWSFIYRK